MSSRLSLLTLVLPWMVIFLWAAWFTGHGAVPLNRQWIGWVPPVACCSELILVPVLIIQQRGITWQILAAMLGILNLCLTLILWFLSAQELSGIWL